jgi:hypothetical protein
MKHNTTMTNSAEQDMTPAFSQPMCDSFLADWGLRFLQCG